MNTCLQTRAVDRARGQRGSLLVEAIVAVAVVAMAGVAVFNATQTSHVARGAYEGQAMAESLLRNQLESVFREPYQPPGGTYALVAAPAGYAVTVDALAYDQASTDVETVRVTVFRDGQAIKSLETLRASR